jgi:hypothetical protein
MSHFIEINGLPDSPSRVPCSGGSMMIGSSSNCEVVIAHPEVAAQALVVDVRSGSFWIQNLNPYSIYAGVEEVASQEWSPCEVETVVQLTKSVSLRIVEGQTSDTPGAAVAKDSQPLDASKILQMVIIAACFIGALFILMADKGEISKDFDRKFDFNATVRALTLYEDDIEYVTVRRYLQQAWMADRRFRNRRPGTVMKCYEILINHRLVRENPDNSETLTEINEYAKRRLSNLRYSGS